MRYINGGNVEILRDRILNESVNLIYLSPQLQGRRAFGIR
jgi:hypothetical protein